jgi:hypothetical protein
LCVLLLLLTVSYFVLLIIIYLIFKLNLNFLYLGFHHAEILYLIEHKVVEFNAPTTYSYYASYDTDAFYAAHDIEGYEQETYGAQESDAFDSYESCETLSTAGTLVDYESDTSTLAGSHDSDYTDDDSGYKGDVETEQVSTPAN